MPEQGYRIRPIHLRLFVSIPGLTLLSRSSRSLAAILYVPLVFPNSSMCNRLQYR
jgi:hypothetical protein